MKNVAVTGADGFIGSHLVEALLARDCNVRALSQYNSFNNWGWLEEIAPHKGLDIWSGDVRDPEFCRRFTEGADTVFHLAALIAIPYSYIAPDSYVDTNIKGTLNMCQAAREHGHQKLLVTSTSEVYGTARYVPIDEKHPRQPQSPYSATKIGADALALSFYNAFNLDVTVVRPFNTYGPRQSARAIIPTIISQIASGIREIKVGDLSPTRDFNYVTDTCRGFIDIAQASNTAGLEINIATGREISMENVFNTIAHLMDADVKWIKDPERLRPSKSEVFRLLGDNKRIKELTGWSPQVSLEEGLKKTINWICEPSHLAKYKPGIYNR
ncbi:MAG: SDR family NAD(P)-dependent oxidoreductase [Muribaculaceae bacterium]|nr:SDR family NAD(P)-dependent oxidoreductase [Muribaculaceae bacterium]